MIWTCCSCCCCWLLLVLAGCLLLIVVCCCCWVVLLLLLLLFWSPYLCKHWPWDEATIHENVQILWSKMVDGYFDDGWLVSSGWGWGCRWWRRRGPDEEEDGRMRRRRRRVTSGMRMRMKMTIPDLGGMEPLRALRPTLCRKDWFNIIITFPCPTPRFWVTINCIFDQPRPPILLDKAKKTPAGTPQLSWYTQL